MYLARQVLRKTNSHKALIYYIRSNSYNDLKISQPIPQYKLKSSLYLDDTNAKNTFPRIFWPDINFEEISSDTSLADNLKHRNITSLDLEKFKKEYEKWKTLSNELNKLEQTKAGLSKDLGKFMSKIKMPRDKALEQPQAKEILTKAQEIDMKINELNKVFKPIGEFINLTGLRLPNSLHKDVPIDKDKLLFELNNGYSGKGKLIRWDKALKSDENQFSAFNNHEDKSQEYDLFMSYLSGSYAKLELTLNNYFLSRLRDIEQFCPNLEYQKGISMVKSALVEGCGIDFNDHEKILNIVRFSRSETNSNEMNVDLHHLPGAASLQSLIMQFVRSKIDVSHLPWVVYTHGKEYSPKFGQKSQFNLIALSSKNKSESFENELKELLNQQNDLKNIFIQNETNSTVKDIFRLLTHLLQGLNIKLRFNSICAKSLEISESYKIIVEAFRPFENKFIQIAEISLLEDFVSRRVQIQTKENDKKSNEQCNYVSIVHCKLADINSIMKCLVESNLDENSKFTLPQSLKPFEF